MRPGVTLLTAGAAPHALRPRSGSVSAAAPRPCRTWRLVTRCLRTTVTSRSGKKRPAAFLGHGHPDGRARREALLRRGRDAQVRPAPRLDHVIASAAEEHVA